MIAKIEQYPIWSLLLFTLIMLGFSIDSFPVSIMESRNFISAREMVTENNWILTTMNGEARYEKPPLPTWITAFFALIFGTKNLLALRFPAILMVFVTGLGTYLFSKKLLNNKSISLIIGFICITSLYTIAIILEAPWDIYAHGFMILGLYQWLSQLKSKNLNLKSSFYFILFIACSVLSKGPVAFYALLLPFIIAFVIAYPIKISWQLVTKQIALLLFGIALGSLWFIYVRYADAEAFLVIAEKETARWSHWEVKPFYYYWSFFTQSGIWTIPAFISLLYPILKDKVKNKKAYKFALIWTLNCVILLSIIPTKKSRYLMPVLIPLSICIGVYLEVIINYFKYNLKRFITLPIYFNFGLIGSICLLIPITGLFSITEWNSTEFLLFSFGIFIFIFVGISIFKKLKAKEIKQVIYLVFLFIMLVGFFLLPLAKKFTQKDFSVIQELDNPKFELYKLGYTPPEIIYLNNDKILEVSTLEVEQLSQKEKIYILTQSRDPNSIVMLQNLFDIKLLKTYDLNTVDEKSKSYNIRLKQLLYELKRK